MPEQDFTKRLTVVVRTDLEGWQAANAIAHISAYIGNKLQGAFDTGESFTTSDAVAFPRNAQYPIILKAAEGSAALKALFEQAQQDGLLHLGFIREMIESSDDAEIEAILASKESKDIEFLGVGVFGENEQIKLLTKSFGLWK